jgi:CMP-N,N'-diacetyllegionaminic acid synthase
MVSLAIITARKNSKRLKNKNKKILGSKPLVSWTIDFAKNIKIFDHILITTDDNDIIKIARKKNILAPWLRPKKLAQDKTSSYKTVIHALKWYEKKYSKVDCIFLLQPTTPFRSKKILLDAYEIFKKTSKSVMSVMQILKKFEDPLLNGSERVKKKIFYTPSGSFYLISPKELRKYKNFINKNNYLYLITSDKLNVDIDDIKDWNLAKRHVN